MRSSLGQHPVSLLGILCAAAGFFAWIVVGWKAFTNLDGMTSKSDEGGRLMIWGLIGTVLMIVGMVILHLSDRAPERDEHEDSSPPR